MSNKICVITGANSGIGKATAIEMAKGGLEVVVLARDSQKSNESINDIVEKSGNSLVQHIKVDLSELESIKKACEEVSSRYPTIDFLINNAGILKRSYSTNSNGLEQTFAVNFLAPFVISRMLMRELGASEHGVLMNVTSALYKKGELYGSIPPETQKFKGDKAYADSKLMVLLDTMYLAREYEHANMHIHCVHPGVVGTDVFREYPTWFAKLLNLFITKPAKAGKDLASLVLRDGLSGGSGQYFNVQKAEPVKDLDARLSTYQILAEQTLKLVDL